MIYIIVILTYIMHFRNTTITRKMKVVKVTPENAHEEGLFCLKNTKRSGFEAKYNWFVNEYKKGLNLHIARNDEGDQLGFIEYVPSEEAWKPINAKNFMVIHCLMVYPKKNKNLGIGSKLIQKCEEDARALGRAGMAVMTSDKSWVAGKSVFLKNGFEVIDTKGRFELLSKKFKPSISNPEFFDWESRQKDFKGWNLVYADQCPYHEKAAEEIYDEALDQNIDLKIRKIDTPYLAQQAPSGFGVFTLLHDGRVLEDHYISRTRFKNILKKELMTSD